MESKIKKLLLASHVDSYSIVNILRGDLQGFLLLPDDLLWGIASNSEVVFHLISHGDVEIMGHLPEEDFFLTLRKLAVENSPTRYFIEGSLFLSDLLIKNKHRLYLDSFTLRYIIGDGNWEYYNGNSPGISFSIKTVKEYIYAGNVGCASALVRSFRTSMCGWKKEFPVANWINDSKEFNDDKAAVLKVIYERLEKDKDLSLLGHSVPREEMVEEYMKYPEFSLQRKYIIGALNINDLFLLGNPFYEREGLADILDEISLPVLQKSFENFSNDKFLVMKNIANYTMLFPLFVKDLPSEYTDRLTDIIFDPTSPISMKKLFRKCIPALFDRGVNMMKVPEEYRRFFELLKTRPYNKELLEEYILEGRYLPQEHENAILHLNYDNKPEVKTFLRTFHLDPEEFTSMTTAPIPKHILSELSGKPPPEPIEMNQVEYASRISAEYAKTLSWYIYEDYGPFNEKINKGLPLDEEDLRNQAILSEIIYKSPKVGKRVFLYRGITAKTPYDSQLKVLGKTYIYWRSVTSCAQYREVSDAFSHSPCCMFIIEVPKGSIAFDILSFKRSEPEVLLPFNSLHEFVSEKIINEKRIIHVRYVGYVPITLDPAKGKTLEELPPVFFSRSRDSSIEGRVFYKAYPKYLVDPDVEENFTTTSPMKNSSPVKRHTTAHPVESMIIFFNKRFPGIGKGLEDTKKRVLYLKNTSTSVEFLKSIRFSQEIPPEGLDESEEDYFLRNEGKVTKYLEDLGTMSL